MPIDTVAIWHGVERPPQAQGSSNPTTVSVSSLAGPAAQAPAGLLCQTGFNFASLEVFTAERGGSDVESGRGSVASKVGAPGTEEACLVAAG